jgi:hypothetical protein
MLIANGGAGSPTPPCCFSAYRSSRLSVYPKNSKPYQENIMLWSTKGRFSKASLYPFIAVMLVTFVAGCGTHVTPPEGSTAAKMEGVWSWLNAEKANSLSDGMEYKLCLVYGHRNEKNAPLVLMTSLLCEEKITAKGRLALVPFGRVGVQQATPTELILPDLAISGNEAAGEKPRMFGGKMFARVVLDEYDPDVLYLSTDALNPQEPWDKKTFSRIK